MLYLQALFFIYFSLEAADHVDFLRVGEERGLRERGRV